jgi:hypothetical protein
MASKRLQKDAMKVSGQDNRFRVESVRRPQIGWVQWIICPSPVVGLDVVLQCSHHVAIVCRWPGELTGSARLFGRGYVACSAGKSLSGAQDLLARFIHWRRGWNYLDTMREFPFALVAA